MSIGQRFIQGYYDASYPPDVLGGGTNPNDPHITSIAPATGVVSVLTSIVVTGTNFAADAVVEVGGVALVTTGKTPTSLTGAYTPGTTGAKQVTVRNVALAEESNNAVFTVTATELVADEAAAQSEGEGNGKRRASSKPTAPAVAPEAAAEPTAPPSDEAPAG